MPPSLPAPFDNVPDRVSHVRTESSPFPVPCARTTGVRPSTRSSAPRSRALTTNPFPARVLTASDQVFRVPRSRFALPMDSFPGLCVTARSWRTDEWTLAHPRGNATDARLVSGERSEEPR